MQVTNAQNNHTIINRSMFMNSKLFALKRARRVIGMLVLVGLLSPLSPNAAVQGATPAQAGTAIPCDSSPFGHVLALGKENEVFLGFNKVDQPFPNTLGSYRFDWNPVTGHLEEQDPALDTNIGASPIASWATTAADLDGDGKAEFVQGFTDANGQYQIVVNKNGSPLQSHAENWPNHTYRAMASGDILGRDDGSQQVVIASRGGDGALTIAVFGGAAGGNVGS